MTTLRFAGGFDATPAGATPMDAASTFEAWMGVAASSWSTGYRAAPALMLGLLALIAVPLMAFSSVVIHRWQRRRARPALSVQREPASALPSHRYAFLELLDERGRRIPLENDFVRIGRERDNDIRIPSKRVHRYHAAIHREEFGVYRLTDLAGEGGNGVSVNGAPCREMQLEDGDLIELGPGRLRFHAGLV